ncbi:double-strand break repair protein AddB [Pseudoponticoccus marisrubri]|uniref:Double-strand break repair protein AddB n=1 Tax=Pseudoponticoccus marisrubri TaxID=1685382 RepID=A0A0W7WGC1_9RHOB|nr:double-strand break repair protein AddB [Pseudoponticoccus marisrubri]KUF09528.1 double-strand break repair protein AddB [Pseudoponticoccus marisrubri]
MFDTPGPRLFALPPGVDFPRAVVDGLRDRLGDGDPAAIARVEIFVNTTRMARRLREIFDSGPASLLPRIRLVTDLADPQMRAALPRPVPGLRRRLELTHLVARLLEQEPDLAPRAALFDLSDSLAALMEEMQTEGVPPDRIATLDVTDQSGHWQRALSFLRIVQGYFAADSAPDQPALTRLALQALQARWAETPPQHPILVAGSTGSRGTTHDFMKTVAGLPQGAVILPGFDSDLPGPVWEQLTDPLTGEDHPQFRFARLLRELALDPSEVAPWSDAPAPSPARNRLISLALRPAPVTHQWLSEGPALPDLVETTADLTLVEAPDKRQEAQAIALRLRQAVADGQSAALITPDRMLTRQVTAALDPLGILPDDSAGTPAQLTPPGRLMRHVAQLMESPLSAELLLTLLKHPLCHRGGGRGPHLLNTRELELHIRRSGWPYPQPGQIRDWGSAADCAGWAEWVARTFCDRAIPGAQPLAVWLDRHVALAEAITAGSDSTDPGALWDENAGRVLRRMVEALQEEAAHGTDMGARDYADLFGALLSREEVRDRDAPHPLIRIWGTQEARVMGADLLILAGLTEGTWPEMPGADPWLNRRMRAEAGLLLPERRIGLAAHDFQQAAGAREVWLTRPLKSDEAETVPSRWLNRLMNLMRGLPGRNGPEAIETMRARGAQWLALAETAERPIPAAPAPRPSPAPPVASRPDRLSVTEIRRLIRDPFAIYAKHCLRLRPLDPLMRAPDALMRGIILHAVLERFVRDTIDTPEALSPDHLDSLAREALEPLPYPTIRRLWQSRLARISHWFCETEIARRKLARPTPNGFEVKGRAALPELGFTLTATADRIDLDARGGAHLYDYKTGAAPSKSEQQHFDKQLLLEAAMAEAGAFEGLDPRHVARAVFISLKPGGPDEVPAPLDEAPPDQVWDEFRQLIAAYADPDRGYTARRALMKDTDIADYDHLSRFGEWDVTDPPVKRGLT